MVEFWSNFDQKTVILIRKSKSVIVEKLQDPKFVIQRDNTLPPRQNRVRVEYINGLLLYYRNTHALPTHFLAASNFASDLRIFNQNLLHFLA